MLARSHTTVWLQQPWCPVLFEGPEQARQTKMSQQLDEKQIEELREAFGMFHDPASGLMSVRDLPDLLRSLGHNPNKDEMRATISEASLLVVQVLEHHFCPSCIQLFLSAAIGQRPRNYLSCSCSSSCCSPFGSFPH